MAVVVADDDDGEEKKQSIKEMGIPQESRVPHRDYKMGIIRPFRYCCGYPSDLKLGTRFVSYKQRFRNPMSMNTIEVQNSFLPDLPFSFCITKRLEI